MERFDHCWRRVLAALLVTVGVLQATAGTVQARELRWATRGALATLDPHGILDTPNFHLLANLYEGLVTRDPDLVIRPSLAWPLLGAGRTCAPWISIFARRVFMTARS
jgi:ABC-type oligopeptide transport system substrate-binding subunit